MSVKIKNISQAEVHVLKEQISYQEGQVISKTLAQNKAVSITLFSFAKGEEISTHESGGDAFVTCLDGVGKITIDGVDVQFKASAAIPRLYRLQFRRDLFHDFADLQKSVDDEKEKDSEASRLNPEILETFENVAYMMAKHADPKGVPGTAEEWLEQFSMFSIYEILPELLELWNANLQTQVQSKKNIARLTAR